MPKTVPPLTENQVSETSATNKPFKLFDGKGLYLLVQPTGRKECGKYWRFKYSFSGKEKLLAFGVYPEVSLTGARVLRDEALLLLDEGIDPCEANIRDKARARSNKLAISGLPSVRLTMGGMVEIRRGRDAVLLTSEESLFVTELLNKVRQQHATD